MSGMLRRLAGQTLGGNKSVIHSMARMPYVAPPVLVQDTEVSLLETGHVPQAYDTPQGVPHAIPPANAQEASDRAQGSLPGQVNALASSVAIRAPAEIQPSNRLSVPEGITAAIDTSEAAAPNPTTMTNTTRADPTAQQVSATSLSGLQQRHTLSTPHSLPAEIMPNFPEKAAAGDPLNRPVVLPVEIVPDSAEKPAPTARQVVVPVVGPSRTDASPSPPRRAQEPETTEVHVHIGRIEVIAVHEAPTQKVRAAPARKSMSLDEYLARRKGGQT